MDTESQGEHHVRTEAETAVMYLQVRNSKGCQETIRIKTEACDRCSLLYDSERTNPADTLSSHL